MLWRTVPAHQVRQLNTQQGTALVKKKTTELNRNYKVDCVQQQNQYHLCQDQFLPQDPEHQKILSNSHGVDNELWSGVSVFKLQ